MKHFLLVMLLFATPCWSSPFAGKGTGAAPTPEELQAEGMEFIALDNYLRLLGRPGAEQSANMAFLEKLLAVTGIEILEDYDQKLLGRIPTAAIHFYLGRNELLKGNLKEARHLLLAVPKWHRYFAESRYLLASHMARENDGKRMEVYLEQCLDGTSNAEEGKNKASYKKVVTENCHSLRARIAFKQGRWQDAINAYDLIDKRAYKWPYLLLEKAWAYYHLGNYNRALGILVTYKSPLMESYFIPEAEVLTALSYFKLCLWEDANIVVDEYYRRFKPDTEYLEGVIAKNKGSQSYFLNLMLQDAQTQNAAHPLVKRLAMQISKQPRWGMDLASLKRLEGEIAELNKIRKKQYWAQDAWLHLTEVRGNLKGKMNHYVKEQYFSFISQVYSLSEELFKIKLETIARKKDLVYASKDLISHRSRGDDGLMKRSRFEYFWKFHGAFWADELGDYSFALKSNCEISPRTEENI